MKSEKDKKIINNLNKILNGGIKKLKKDKKIMNNIDNIKKILNRGIKKSKCIDFKELLEEKKVIHGGSKFNIAKRFAGMLSRMSKTVVPKFQILE